MKTRKICKNFLKFESILQFSYKYFGSALLGTPQFEQHSLISSERGHQNTDDCIVDCTRTILRNPKTLVRHFDNLHIQRKQSSSTCKKYDTPYNPYSKLMVYLMMGGKQTLFCYMKMKLMGTFLGFSFVFFFVYIFIENNEWRRKTFGRYDMSLALLTYFFMVLEKLVNYSLLKLILHTTTNSTFFWFPWQITDMVDWITIITMFPSSILRP